MFAFAIAPFLFQQTPPPERFYFLVGVGAYSSEGTEDGAFKSLYGPDQDVKRLKVKLDKLGWKPLPGTREGMLFSVRGEDEKAQSNPRLPTRQAILNALNPDVNTAIPKNGRFQFLFSYSGHGVMADTGAQGGARKDDFLIPFDAKRVSKNQEWKFNRATAIGFETDLKPIFNKLAAQDRAIIFNMCRENVTSFQTMGIDLKSRAQMKEEMKETMSVFRGATSVDPLVIFSTTRGAYAYSGSKREDSTVFGEKFLKKIDDSDLNTGGTISLENILPSLRDTLIKTTSEKYYEAGPMVIDWIPRKSLQFYLKEHEGTTSFTRAAMNARKKGFPELARYLEYMCAIPGGKFVMGDNTTGVRDRMPAHGVRLSKYWMGRHPVTVGMWKEYLRAKNLPMPDEPKDINYESFNPEWQFNDHPMVSVSWNDIMGESGMGGFCAWASNVCGISLTLPTEAQWEFAARDGREGNSFPWGPRYDSRLLQASKLARADSSGTVSVFRPSQYYKTSLGLVDMVGNVWQWCLDFYDPETYKRDESGAADPVNKSFAPKQNDTVSFLNGDPEPYIGPCRVLRGGSWVSVAEANFLCSHRGKNNPGARYISVGFRLASPGPR